MPCGQEGNVKAKRGRPRKKPDYDRDEAIKEQLKTAVDLVGEPFDDRKERSADALTLRELADAMQMTPLKIRKILITAGYYSTEMSRKIQVMCAQGCSLKQIMDNTGLKKASVNAHLPYKKGIYMMSCPTLNAEGGRLYRKRKVAYKKLLDNVASDDIENYLWDAIVAFADYPFKTENGLSMKYTVRGGEIFFNRKEKSVTRATVIKAFHRARELQKEKGSVDGPKELGTFGASYLYPVFLRLGVCSKKKEIVKNQ